MRLVLITLAGALACRGGTTPPLHPAGAGHDDGHGDLARASLHFTRGEDSEGVYVEPARTDDGEYGGASYGGGSIPPWQYTAANRVKYSPATRPAGAIEGVITWRGAVPATRKTACGAIESARIGDKRGVADVLVYIERVKTARTLPNEGRPASVGGVIVKRGCALMPAVQIVTPLPAPLAIHGDATAKKIRVTPATGGPKVHELQEAGRVSLQVAPGITRVDAEAGDLAAAWVVAIDTPYYAITDDAGRYRIDELPPGTYEVTIWQAPLPGDGNTLTYGAPVIVKRSATVSATKAARLDVAIGR
ncbi:MAG TPA: carboxypeptidase-like regulatory domain-containing protein [Kofleriaceae bacterium]